MDLEFMAVQVELAQSKLRLQGVATWKRTRCRLKAAFRFEGSAAHHAAQAADLERNRPPTQDDLRAGLKYGGMTFFLHAPSNLLTSAAGINLNVLNGQNFHHRSLLQ
jgi:hypothetical protein